MVCSVKRIIPLRKQSKNPAEKFPLKKELAALSALIREKAESCQERSVHSPYLKQLELDFVRNRGQKHESIVSEFLNFFYCVCLNFV